MDIRSRPFSYAADPACFACLLLYPLNRFVLKPHHLGGWFVHDYLNDVICLPLFLPMILWVQRRIGLRRHDRYPRPWEIAQHWAIFSVVFEVVLPRYPRVFRTTADPWDVVAYAVGGTIAGVWWAFQERRV